MTDLTPSRWIKFACLDCHDATWVRTDDDGQVILMERQGLLVFLIDHGSSHNITVSTDVNRVHPASIR